MMNFGVYAKETNSKSNKEKLRLAINPQTYEQSHTPSVVQGGGLMELLPWVFAV